MGTGTVVGDGMGVVVDIGATVGADVEVGIGLGVGKVVGVVPGVRVTPAEGSDVAVGATVAEGVGVPLGVVVEGETASAPQAVMARNSAGRTAKILRKLKPFRPSRSRMAVAPIKPSS